MQRGRATRATVKELDYTDYRGRKYRVLITDDMEDSQAADGVHLGPLDVVDSLDLPEPYATRLHNELHRRKLYRVKDIRARGNELVSALQATFKVDAQLIAEQYALIERDNSN